VSACTSWRSLFPAHILFATYLNIEVEVIVFTITVLGEGSAVELTVTGLVVCSRTSMWDAELKSFTIGMILTQLLAFVNSFAAVTDDVVGVHAPGSKMSPTDSVIACKDRGYHQQQHE